MVRGSKRWRVRDSCSSFLLRFVHYFVCLQEVSQLPEGEAYEFRLMSGEVIRLEQDGSHYLDDKLCGEDSYKGVAYC